MKGSTNACACGFAACTVVFRSGRRPCCKAEAACAKSYAGHAQSAVHIVPHCRVAFGAHAFAGQRSILVVRAAPTLPPTSRRMFTTCKILGAPPFCTSVHTVSQAEAASECAPHVAPDSHELLHVGSGERRGGIDRGGRAG